MIPWRKQLGWEKFKDPEFAGGPLFGPLIMICVLFAIWPFVAFCGLVVWLEQQFPPPEELVLQGQIVAFLERTGRLVLLEVVEQPAGGVPG